MPIRFATRSTCRSTGNPGTPSAWPSTTLAVFRPTPGSSTSASIVVRHFAAMTFHQRARHAHERLRFRSEEACRVNLPLQLSAFGRRERRRIRIPLEEGWRDAIDAGIGRLRRQNRGDEQLIWILVVELGVGVGMLRVQLPDDRQGTAGAARLPLVFSGSCSSVDRATTSVSRRFSVDAQLFLQCGDQRRPPPAPAARRATSRPPARRARTRPRGCPFQRAAPSRRR